MTETPDPREHSINELWSAQRHTQKEVAETRAEVSAIKKGMEGLERGFVELTHELRRMSIPKQTNWGWLIAALLGLGAIIGLYVAPVSEKVRDQQGDMQYLVRYMFEDRVRMESELATGREWRRLMESCIVETHRR